MTAADRPSRIVVTRYRRISRIKSHDSLDPQNRGVFVALIHDQDPLDEEQPYASGVTVLRYWQYQRLISRPSVFRSVGQVACAATHRGDSTFASNVRRGLGLGSIQGCRSAGCRRASDV